nr:MAG TPA: hypothetical protein [Caudoviricetes sp.]
MKREVTTFQCTSRNLGSHRIYKIYERNEEISFQKLISSLPL